MFIFVKDAECFVDKENTGRHKKVVYDSWY